MLNTTQTPNGVSSLRVAWFPHGQYAHENAYWPRLQAALEARGVAFADSSTATFSARWLLQHQGSVRVAHLHFIQPFYHYELVHARLRWVLRFARNLVLARALGYRSVFTLHNLLPDHPLKPAWVDYLGHWVASNLTDRVIVHSQLAARLLAERYRRYTGVTIAQHPSYIEVYPNSITRAEARRRLDLQSGDVVFAFVGGIRPGKGLPKLLRAFRQLRDERLRLLIAGNPSHPPEQVEQLQAAAGRDPRIRTFLRYIPDDELQVYLNAADAVILPFDWVLTSGSAMLAMSFGRPVVAPALGTLPELITPEAGLLYDPSTDDALLDALRQCLSLDLRGMGNAALAKVQGYTWDGLAAETLATYR